MNEFKQSTDILADAEAMPASMYNSFVQARISQTMQECVDVENVSGAYGDMKEIFSDENVFSYSVTTYPSVTTNFYNIAQVDGTDITLDALLDNSSEYEDCEFYIKNENAVVVINDGEEIEIPID